jgi:hypothetical protein
MYTCVIKWLKNKDGLSFCKYYNKTLKGSQSLLRRHELRESHITNTDKCKKNCRRE